MAKNRGVDRWNQIEQLLDQLLDTEPDGRSRLLAGIRSGDPQLGAELERLLDATAAAEHFLEDPAPDYAWSLISEVIAGSRLPPGSRVGGYEIIRELGRGGAATVHLAYDRKHDRRVAVKVPHPEIAAGLGTERFLREIRFASQLQHPNILPLHDSGESDGLLYYVMPYVEGESLRARLKREPQLPLTDVLQIANEVCDALGHSHAHGVVHRDIKPENILLSGGHALVSDFGIARAMAASGGERLTATGIILGTPEYMSPEQAAGGSQLDGRSDIYSLGCVVYETLVGEPPFTAATAAGIFARQIVDPVPSIRILRQTVPVPLEQAVTKALARIPDDRFANAQQFAVALRESASGPDLPPEPAGPKWRQIARYFRWLGVTSR